MDTIEGEVTPADDDGAPVKKQRSPQHRRSTLAEERNARRLRAVELSASGASYPEISAAVGMSVSAVRAAVAEFAPALKRIGKVQDFREIRADLFAGAQAVALKSALSSQKLKKASFLATVNGVEKLHKMERLERGLSTENHSVKVFARVSTPDDLPDESEDLPS